MTPAEFDFFSTADERAEGPLEERYAAEKERQRAINREAIRRDLKFLVRIGLAKRLADDAQRALEQAVDEALAARDRAIVARDRFVKHLAVYERVVGEATRDGG